jgi:hypothetical protein
MARMNRTNTSRSRLTGLRQLWKLTWALWGGLSALGCDAQVDTAYQGEPLLTIQGQVEAPLSVGPVEVGVLWLRPVQQPLDVAVECSIVFSGETPSACVAACGTPSCDDLARLEAWEACAGECEGPDGLSEIIVNVVGDRLFNGAVGQTTPVEGAFPAQFRLDLLTPPPDDVLSRGGTGEHLAIGLFVALDPAGAPFELDLDATPFPSWLMGGSGSHVLMYSPNGVPSDSDWGSLLGYGVESGFHLVSIERSTNVQVSEDEEEVAFMPVSAAAASQVQLTVADPASIDWPLTELAAEARAQ